MAEIEVIRISTTDDNADWVKALPGAKDEHKIHAALAKIYAAAKDAETGEAD